METLNQSCLPIPAKRSGWISLLLSSPALLICMAMLVWTITSAQTSANTPAAGNISEESLKAAFVYKFLGYAEWPSASFKNARSSYVIGVIGSPDIADALAQIVPGRTVNGREVLVKKLKDGESLAGLHLLVIDGLGAVQLGHLLAEAQRHSILTVTQTDGALSAGSIINFVNMDRKIRFEVSLEAAEKSGLKLSSRLLPVAHRVIPKRS
ncbi:MAG: YfiR family protein [Betaproteobacteria bacterium]